MIQLNSIKREQKKKDGWATYLNLGLGQVSIGHPIIVAHRQLVLVDDEADVPVEVGERHHGQDEGEHEDDDGVDGPVQLLVLRLGAEEEEAAPVLGALHEGLIAVLDGADARGVEHRRRHENGQQPDGRHHVLGPARLGHHPRLVPGDDHHVPEKQS